MTNFILITLMHVSALGTDQTDFEQAYQQSLTTGRPLVVLVGAVWCPACQKMKNSILPQVAGAGGLKKVIFTYVDYDQHQQLASRLSRGTSIPQLIRLDQTPTGWKSKCLVGAKSPREVYDFINARLPEEKRGNNFSDTDRPRNNSLQSTPGEPVRSLPTTLKSRTYSPANVTRGQPPSRAERANSFPLWALLFKKRSRGTRNWHNGTTPPRYYSTVHHQYPSSKKRQ